MTVATTLLKPGGYERLVQLAQVFEGTSGQAFNGVNVGKLDALLKAASGDSHYARLDPKFQHRKNGRELPLMDCFMAPCIETCPIHQDITAYMDLVAEGKYVEALQIIIEKNPLPFITGTVCYHTCMNSCTRNFYEDAVEIRRNKLIAAEKDLTASWHLFRPRNQSGNGSRHRRRSGRAVCGLLLSPRRRNGHGIR